MLKYSWIKESASGRARSEKHLEIGHHGETEIRVSMVRVSAADRFITILYETSGAIQAGSSWVGRMLVARFFLVWNHV